MPKSIFFLLLFSLGAQAVAASQLDYPDRDGRFLQRGEEGWFWYEPVPEGEEPEKVKPEPPKPKKSVETLAKPKKKEPEVKSPPPPPPAAMSAKWFRANIKKYRDKAWSNPTPENVSAFLYIQKMAMDRASKFANTWKKVVATDPMLDANSNAPTTTSGTLRMKATTKKARKDLLSSVSDSVGLMFFFNDSEYSREQARSLDAISQLYGIDVLSVSTDGSRLPKGILGEVVMDNGQAKKMNVRQVPATHIAFNDGTTKPIGVGMFARPLMEDRILLVAQMQGVIADDDYMATQNQLKREDELIELISPDAYENAAPGTTDNEGYIPPDQLLKLIREELNK